MKNIIYRYIHLPPGTLLYLCTGKRIIISSSPVAVEVEVVVVDVVVDIVVVVVSSPYKYY